MSEFAKSFQAAIKKRGPEHCFQVRMSSQDIMLVRVISVEGDVALVKRQGPNGAEILLNLNLVEYMQDMSDSETHKFID